MYIRIWQYSQLNIPSCESLILEGAALRFAMRKFTSRLESWCRESLILRAGREKNCDMNARVGQDAYSICVNQYFLKTCASYSQVRLMYGPK